MQIHELNNFTGELNSGAFVAVDNGNDTGKLSIPNLLSDTEAEIDALDTSLNARIDNIIAGGAAPSEAEVTDARLGADGITYPSLGDAIRSQFTNTNNELKGEIEATSNERTFTRRCWENRTISPTTGATAASSTSLKPKDAVFIEGSTIIKAKSGYKFHLYAYQLDGTYVGCWDGDSFAKSWDYKFITEFVSADYNEYKFKVTLLKADESAISTSDGDNLVVLYKGLPDAQTSINNLESDVYESTNFADSNWRIGYISPTSGLNATDSTGISFIDGFYVSAENGFESVKCDSAYGFNVFAYQLDGTFVGSWDGTQFAKSWDYVRLREFNLKAYPSYKFRFALFGEDDHTIAISEKSNITFTLSNFISLNRAASTVNELIAYTPADIMELGNINGAPIPNAPWWTNSTTRVRTMEDHLIPLSVGDKITLKDYTGVTMYVLWENSANTWKQVGWISRDFEVTEAGDYALLLRYDPETTVDDYNDLASLIVIYKQTSIFDDVYAAINKNQRRDWIVKSINHRGFGRTAPENTLPAFKLSAKYGWKYVETDVRFTSDGVAVLLHDLSINRTARNADGSEISSEININSITYAQALTYDFGIWMGTQYAGTKIPTLEEFLVLCKKLSLEAYLELKNYSSADVQYITDMVNRCGMREHVSYICFAFSALETVLSYEPTARVGLVGDLDASMIPLLQGIKTDSNDVFMDASTNSLTTALIYSLADARIPLEVYTPNSWITIDAMDRYITGVTSDYNVAGQDLYNHNID